MQKVEGNIIKSLNNIKDIVSNELTMTNPYILEDGRICFPMNKINIAFVSSEGNLKNKQTDPEFGIGGGGLSVTPYGILVIDSNEDIKLKVLDEELKGVDKWKDFIISTINLIKKK